ncbi:NAD-dependent epimerase/dehydratase family protein [Roseivivax sp.]
MRIVFTGGSGKAGRHVLPYLRDRGHRILNLDRVPLGAEGISDLSVDLTDAGQVWAALTQPFDLSELDGPAPGRPEALVHFAAVPRIGITADPALFANNVTSTYNVIEAALGLGIRKVIFASSETSYGICFAQGEKRPDYLPVDEEHPTVPHDSYAMAKVANEVTARSFQARTGADIYGLRINNVIEPHEYAEMFPAFVDDPDLRRRNIFAYIDARDLGLMVERCLAVDGLGYEVFNVANPEPSVDLSMQEIARRYYTGVEMRREMGPRETPYSIEKARRLLGFEPPERWRAELAAAGQAG